MPPSAAEARALAEALHAARQEEREPVAPTSPTMRRRRSSSSNDAAHQAIMTLREKGDGEEADLLLSVDPLEKQETKNRLRKAMGLDRKPKQQDSSKRAPFRPAGALPKRAQAVSSSVPPTTMRSLSSTTKLVATASKSVLDLDASDASGRNSGNASARERFSVASTSHSSAEAGFPVNTAGSAATMASGDQAIPQGSWRSIPGDASSTVPPVVVDVTEEEKAPTLPRVDTGTLGMSDLENIHVPREPLVLNINGKMVDVASLLQPGSAAAALEALRASHVRIFGTVDEAQGLARSRDAAAGESGHAPERAILKAPRVNVAVEPQTNKALAGPHLLRNAQQTRSAGVLDAKSDINSVSSPSGSNSGGGAGGGTTSTSGQYLHQTKVFASPFFSDDPHDPHGLSDTQKMLDEYYEWRLDRVKRQLHRGRLLSGDGTRSSTKPARRSITDALPGLLDKREKRPSNPEQLARGVMNKMITAQRRRSGSLTKSTASK